jgi:SAM-dependent methyltransferase
MPELRSCPQCDRDNTAVTPSKYSKDEWQIKDCPSCGFVYLENAPVYESLKEDFAWEKTSAKESQERKAAEPAKQVVSNVAKKARKEVLKRDKLGSLIEAYFGPGRVLDIGCANARLLAKLDETFIPFGVEISKDLAKKGHKKLKKRGGEVIHADALSGTSGFPEDHFSGIIMSSFLEHETNPKPLLEQCFRTLDKDGAAIIKVPNYGCLLRKLRGRRWCGFRYPDHVNYFTPATLRKMVTDVGFKIAKFDLPDRHLLSDNMWMVVQKP